MTHEPCFKLLSSGALPSHEEYAHRHVANLNGLKDWALGGRNLPRQQHGERAQTNGVENPQGLVRQSTVLLSFR